MFEFHRFVRATVLVALCCLFGAAGQSSAADPTMWKGELPIRQPWLRDHLPDDALIYVRVPNVYGLLTMPKGNALDSALRSRANVENVERIRRGISDNVLPHIPAFANVQLRLLEQHLRSPIEVAVFLAEAPSFVISINLDVTSDAAFTEMLDVMGVGLLRPLENGVGQVAAVPVPMFLKFDEGTGQLVIHAGPAVIEAQFNALQESFDNDAPHRMKAIEERVDESGQGLFLWIDAERAVPLLQATLPPEQSATLTASGLNEVSAAGFGWGVANGKGRLSLVADLPVDGDRGYLPLVANDLSATAVGEPDGLFLLSIPTFAEFERMESLALSSLDPEKQDKWRDGKLEFQELSGVAVEEFFRAIGPELLVIFDDAGDYSALRIRDKKLWKSIVERLSSKAGTAPERKRIAGDTYFHIGIPNQLGMLDEDDVGEIGWFAVLLGRQRDHIYWIEDDDFIYLASVPQVLMDRNAMRARTDIGEWLQNKQKIDANAAVLSFSGTSEKLPRRLYGAYIEVLQILADIGEADVDMWSMPTARQLGLPSDGTLGFTVSLDDPTLAAELTFENNPGEFLGAAGGVAAVGIMAAIAIPAYQDYTVRAQISTGLNLAAGPKAAVAEFYHSTGRFPGPDDVDEMSIFATDTDDVLSVVVEANTGNVVIYFSDSVAGGGELMLYSHIGAGGSVRWNCSGSFDDKHLPAACRTDTPLDLEDGDT